MKSAMSSRTTAPAMTFLMQRILPALLVAPLLTLSAAAFAADGRLSFRGSITQPTCAVAPMPAVPVGHEHSQRVVTGMSAEIHTACGAQAVPVATQFLPMSPTAMAKAGSGILTLTYQ